MTIEYLSGMIADLAVEYGRVMLPGLGVFVSETAPASFADKGFTILPPYRTLAFYESQGDGTLLVEKYAASAKLTPARAQSEIAAAVAQIEKQLDEDGVAELPALGKIKRTLSGSLLFVADEDLDVSAEWMALDPVSLKTQRRETALPSNDDAGDINASSFPSGEGVGEGEDKSSGGALEVRSGAKKTAPAAKRPGAGWIVLIIILGLAALFPALFFTGVHFFPDLLDRLLYSAGELELLHYFGL